MAPEGTLILCNGVPKRFTPHPSSYGTFLYVRLPTKKQHGALSEPAGKVSVDWTADHQSVTINWREKDGPKASAPSRYNFGSKLILRTLKELNAEFEPTFAESGYCYRLKVPLV
jgi:hypothetical protein